MALDHEALPCWLSYAAAKLNENEGEPDPGAVDGLIARWLEWSSVVLLCDCADRQADLDQRLEEAMRTAMTRPMDFNAWRVVFEALAGGPRATELLGVALDEELPADHPIAQGCVAVTGDPDGPLRMSALLRALADPYESLEAAAAPQVHAALAHLIDSSTAMRDFALCWIERVDERDGRFEVRHRVFGGTAWPVLASAQVGQAPRFEPGDVVFWDRSSRRVHVPNTGPDA